VTILTYAERQAHWEWCREFIDREAIYRVDDTHPMLPGKNPKGRYTFQYYLRAGDQVRILAGPFRGQLGLFAGMKPHERVEVLLALLGGRSRVLLPENHIVLA
jgi:transcription antitermination factor NusG